MWESNKIVSSLSSDEMPRSTSLFSFGDVEMRVHKGRGRGLYNAQPNVCTRRCRELPSGIVQGRDAQMPSPSGCCWRSVSVSLITCTDTTARNLIARVAIPVKWIVDAGSLVRFIGCIRGRPGIDRQRPIIRGVRSCISLVRTTQCAVYDVCN